MELVHTPEQEEMRRTVRRFFETKSPSTAVRALMADETGFDAEVWRQMAEQLGLQGLAIPEEYGGVGLGFVELAIVQEEAGKVLLASPLFASAVLATNALLDSGDEEAKKDLLPGLADGSRIGTLAITEESGRWDLDSVELSARQNEGGWQLTGTKSYVLYGNLADLILVAARTEAGLSLFAVEGDASGLTRTALPTLDQTRKLAKLSFESTPARLVGTDGGATETLSKTLDKAAVALAAEQVGGMQAVLDMVLEYQKLRQQFGAPIGSFQVNKHKASEIFVQLESARAAVQYAVSAVADDAEDVPIVASLVKAYASEAFFFAAGENIQMHGGIGFTWDHDAHLYFKRAKTSQLLFGDGVYHRDQLVDRIGV